MHILKYLVDISQNINQLYRIVYYVVLLCVLDTISKQ